MDLKNFVASIPGFPKEGIIFRDCTPIISNPEAFKYAINQISEFAKNVGANVIMGPEARGFIFGCPVAYQLGLPFVPVRKPGKLPREQVTEDYDLEYGKNTLCIHTDSLKKGDKVLIIDDLLATGGTVGACEKLAEKLGATVVGAAFVIELVDLKGREKFNCPVLSLTSYEGE